MRRALQRLGSNVRQQLVAARNTRAPLVADCAGASSAGGHGTLAQIADDLRTEGSSYRLNTSFGNSKNNINKGRQNAASGAPAIAVESAISDAAYLLADTAMSEDSQGAGSSMGSLASALGLSLNSPLSSATAAAMASVSAAAAAVTATDAAAAASAAASAAMTAAAGFVSAAAATHAGLNLWLLRTVTGADDTDAALAIITTVAAAVKAVAEADAAAASAKTDAEETKRAQEEGRESAYRALGITNPSPVSNHCVADRDSDQDRDTTNVGALSSAVIMQYPTVGALLKPVLECLGHLSGHKPLTRDGATSESLLPMTPKLIYCSRTHSQIAQVIGEVRKVVNGVFPPGSAVATAPYTDLRVVSLGSRAVLCTNPAVRALGSAEAINDKCSELRQSKPNKVAKITSQNGVVQSRNITKDDLGESDLTASDSATGARETGGCPYLRPQSQFSFRQLITSEVMDLEQITALGTAAKACGYYASRDAVAEADVVLAPYAALFHGPTREALGIPLKGNVIVVDEAHNLVETIHSLSSAGATAGQLFCARRQLRAYQARYSSRLSAENRMYIAQLVNVVSALFDLLTSDQWCGVDGRPLDDSASGLSSPAVSLSTTDTRAGTDVNAELGISSNEDETALLVRPNVLSVAANIDNINLFTLCAWVDKSMLMRKLIGFIEHIDSTRCIINTTASTQSAPTDDASWFGLPSAKDTINETGSAGPASKRARLATDSNVRSCRALDDEDSVVARINAATLKALPSDVVAATGLANRISTKKPCDPTEPGKSRGLFLTKQEPDANNNNAVTNTVEEKDDVLAWVAPEGAFIFKFL